MSNWNSEDFMEIGDSGWIPAQEGWYINKYTKHTMDEVGREYDENGNLVFDPNQLN